MSKYSICKKCKPLYDRDITDLSKEIAQLKVYIRDLKKQQVREMLEYILFRLPIYDDNNISLEEIAKKFKLDNYDAEATQEEIAEYLLKNI